MTDPQAMLADCDTLGDTAIFNQHKTAFFCSRRCPASVVLPSYEWARRMLLDKQCVISGFHTGVEEDVWKLLLQARSPMIWVCARDMLRQLFPETRRAVDGGHLLIVSPFDEGERRMTKELASKRNRFVMAAADSIVVAHAAPGGRLAADLAAYSGDAPLTHLPEPCKASSGLY